MAVIDTPRLMLRPFGPDDLEAFYEYARHPDVGPNAGWAPHACMEDSEHILRSFIGNSEILAIEDKESRRVIGSIGMHPDRVTNHPNGRMLGYVLSSDYWGKGLMTEAVCAMMDHLFQTTGLDVLTVSHFAHNARSKRVIEKAGFTFDRLMPKSYERYDGVMMDEVCYILTRAAYNVLHA